MDHYQTWREQQVSQSFSTAHPNQQQPQKTVQFDEENNNTVFRQTVEQIFQPRSDEIKSQFLMDKTQSIERKFQNYSFDLVAAVNKYINNDDYLSTNNAFHQLTDKSKKALATLGQEHNPVLDELDPSTFEVAAKKQSTMWQSEQYKDTDFRKDLLQTTNRIAQDNLPDRELLENMRVKDFNNRVTIISEYSNALNRGRVFINPKFSSC